MFSAAKTRVAGALQSVVARCLPSQVTYAPARLSGLSPRCGEQYFIGYYDVQPFSDDEAKLLMHSVSKGQDAVRVGYLHLESGRFESLGTTSCWCWQLGARLQFWDRNHIVYNAASAGQPCAHVTDLTGNVVQTLPWNIYAIHKPSRRAAVVDFGRLFRHRPGYGYRILDSSSMSHEADILLVSLDTRQVCAIVSVDDAWNAAVQSGAISPDTRNAPRYLNHPIFSPSGERFAFVLVVEVGSRRRLAMMTASVQTGAIHKIMPHPHTTHNWWADDSHLVAFANSKGGRRGNYLVWNLVSGEVEPLGKAWPVIDGHPSSSPKTEWWVTDTYPNLLGFQQLHLLRQRNAVSSVCVARFFAPLGMRDDKCDLHPRLSPSGRMIAVDTAFDGHRKVAVFDVSAVVRQ